MPLVALRWLFGLPCALALFTGVLAIVSFLLVFTVVFVCTLAFVFVQLCLYANKKTKKSVLCVKSWIRDRSVVPFEGCLREFAAEHLKLLTHVSLLLVSVWRLAAEMTYQSLKDIVLVFYRMGSNAPASLRPEESAARKRVRFNDGANRVRHIPSRWDMSAEEKAAQFCSARELHAMARKNYEEWEFEGEDVSNVVEEEDFFVDADGVLVHPANVPEGLVAKEHEQETTINPILPQVLDGPQDLDVSVATTESDEEPVERVEEDVPNKVEDPFEEDHTRMVAGMGLHLVLTRATGPEKRVLRSSRIARLREKGVVPNYRC